MNYLMAIESQDTRRPDGGDKTDPCEKRREISSTAMEILTSAQELRGAKYIEPYQVETIALPSHLEQRFLSSHAATYNTFNVQRHLTSASTHRAFRESALQTWSEVVAAA